MDAKLSQRITNFALKFCNELEKDKTTVCSPLSAEVVLALLALGCKNQTRQELLKALDIPDDEALRSSFSYLTSTLKTMEQATLKMANKIYVKKEKKLKPELLKDAEDVFDASIEQLDFEEKEAAVSIINEWVADKTNNKINNMVTPDAFNKHTNVVLINAIYFQARWRTPFKNESTRDRPFHINNTTQIQVSQMYSKKMQCGFLQSENLKSKILEIYYKDLEASMVIVLPNEIEGLDYVVDQLMAGYDLTDDLSRVIRRSVTVQMPKFKIQMTIDLKQVLSELGIKSIFDEETSDIDMLTSNEKLFVSKAIQKAFIEMDETGTVAAAATTKYVYTTLCARHYKTFIADRPFLYLLNARKIPLFIGMYRGVATEE